MRTQVTTITTNSTDGEIVVTTGGSVREGDLTADRRLCLNAAGEPVEANSPDSAFLLAAEGHIILKEQAEQLGLRMEAGRVVGGSLRPYLPPLPDQYELGVFEGSAETASPEVMEEARAIAARNQAALDTALASTETQEAASDGATVSEDLPAEKRGPGRPKRAG